MKTSLIMNIRIFYVVHLQGMVSAGPAALFDSLQKAKGIYLIELGECMCVCTYVRVFM